MACQGHCSHAWQGEDAAAWEREQSHGQSGWTVRHWPGRTALAEPSLPQGTAHPRAGSGAAWDTNSREQHYRKQLCSLLGSLPGGSTQLLGPLRPEGEGKEKSIFSLSPSSEHRGRERRVWIKISFLTVSSL